MKGDGKCMVKKRQWKKAGVILTVVVLLMQLIIPAGGAYAEAVAATQPPGSGVEGDPYLISTPGHLLWMSENNTTNWSFDGKYFKQTADIDMTGIDFLPIGDIGNYFAGKYNGNGHKISNLSINTGIRTGVGLFGSVHGNQALVRSLTLENVAIINSKTIGTYNYVGGIAGENEATIEYCNITGTSTISATGNAMAGGITGYSVGGIVRNCSNSADVSTNYAGDGGSRSAGGIVGENASFSVIENCLNIGNITLGPTTSAEAGSGGITGKNYNSYGDQGIVRYTLNLGTVTKTDNGQAGGIIGYDEGGVTTSTYFLSSAAPNGIGYDVTLTGATDTNAEPQTAENLKDVNTYTGWNFDTVWKLDPLVNNGFPHLIPLLPEFDGISAEIGNDMGETLINVADSLGIDNRLVIKFAEAPIATPLYGSAAPQGETVTDPYISGENFSIDADVYKYIGVYEVNQTDEVVKFSEVTPNVRYMEGLGTAEAPFQVTNAYQLSKVYCNPDDYYRLMADIDMTGVSDYIPIGTDNLNRFNGTFDGDNHIISNLTLTSGDYSYLGLFGQIGSGTVRDLELKDITINNTKAWADGAGGLTGLNLEGTISNCRVTGNSTITGGASVGGIAGEHDGGSIEQCSNNASIAANVDYSYYVGGIAGGYWGGSITDCYNTGSVTGNDGAETGGIVGEAWPWPDDFTRNCYNTGTVSTGSSVGGIAGYWGDGILENTYFLDTSAELPYGADDTGSAQAVARTSAEMQDRNTYTGWDFTETWAIDSDINSGFPYLQGAQEELTPVGITGNWADNAAAAEGTDYSVIGAVYTIKTAVGLAWLARQVNGGDSFSGKTVELDSDLDISDHYWIPIGTAHPNYYSFAGVFDGKGHKITGLSIGTSVESPGTNGFEGLFSVIGSDGEIKHLGVEGAVYAGAGEYGGILAAVNYGEITDCYTRGEIAGANGAVFIGGLVASNEEGLIANSYSTADAASSDYDTFPPAAGGLVGRNTGSGNYGIIVNSFATGNVSVGSGSFGNTAYAGGLVGVNENKGRIENCFATGNITGGANAGIGGMVGFLHNGFDELVPNAKNVYWNSDAVHTLNGSALDLADKKGAGEMLVGSDTTTSKTADDIKASAFVTELNNNITGSTSVPNTGYLAWGPDEANENNGYPVITDEPVNTGTQPGDDDGDGGGGGGGSTGNTISVEQDGRSTQVPGTISSGTDGERTTATIKADDAAIQKLVNDGAKGTVITLPVNSAADVVTGQLNGQTVKTMEQREAVLEVKTNNVTYKLPASQINIDDISKQLGQQVELKDVRVDVTIAAPSADTVKIVEDAANKDNYQIVVNPVEFNITCTSGGNTVEVTKFNAYVERTVAIPDGVDSAKITTGIIVESDGTARHVPTKITVVNGRHYAVINSLTNSTYSVIWHPLEFSDVIGHWAREAVNDMGSRMVISGIGNGMFEPDRDITRAEFAAILVRGLGLQPGEGSKSFKDVDSSKWYSDYIKTAYEYKIISGYDADTFGPSDKITREQAMAMTARAMAITELPTDISSGETDKLLAGFTDAAQAADYAKDSIAVCVKTGVVSGRSSTIVAPKDNITRAEIAVIIKRLLQKSDLI